MKLERARVEKLMKDMDAEKERQQQIANRPFLCIWCDRPAGTSEHPERKSADCPQFKEDVKNGWKVKVIQVDGKDRFALDDGYQLWANLGKGGCRQKVLEEFAARAGAKIISCSIAEEIKEEKGKSSTPSWVKSEPWPGAKVEASFDINAVLIDGRTANTIFNPIEFASEGIFVEMSSDNFVSAKSIFKGICNLDFSDEEIMRARETLASHLGVDGPFTLETIAHELITSRKTVDALTKRKAEDSGAEPEKKQKPDDKEKEGWQQPKNPQPRIPLPTAQEKESEKKQQFKYGFYGPLADMDPGKLAEDIMDRFYLKGELSLKELAVLSPSVQKTLKSMVTMHRIVNGEIPVSVQEPGVSDDDKAFIYTKIMETGMDAKNLPEPVVQVLLGNAILAGQDPGFEGFLKSKDKYLDRYGRISKEANLHALNEKYSSLNYSGIREVADFRTEYSTLPSPQLKNVIFQNKIVITKVPQDEGAEANFCSYELAKQTQEENILSRDILIFMLAANNESMRMHALIRNCKLEVAGLKFTQPIWVLPPQENGSMFRLLLGSPFLFASRCSTYWDELGNKWSKLTSQDGSKSAHIQVTNVNDPRAIIDVKPTSFDVPTQSDFQ
jgi:hypothetical protein